MNMQLKHVSLLLLAFTFSFIALVVDYGNWFDYVLDMEKEMEKGEYDIHLIYFEDLKEVGLSENFLWTISTRVGSHVVSVRIHCTEKWRTSCHTDVLSKSK